MRRGIRWRPLAAAVCCIALVAVTSVSQAAKPRQAFSPFRVAGLPMRSITVTEFRQFASLSIPDFLRLKSDGFNTITVYVYRSVDDLYDNSQSSGPFTEPDASLGATFEAARAAGLAVQFIPTVWVGSGQFEWRGHVRPPDVAAFFDSYREMVNHYADLATRYGVEMFGVGSEMGRLEPYADEWRQTVGEARQHYRGPITYFTVTGAAYSVRWWDAVDYPSISLYLSLSAAPRPSYDEIVSAWRRVQLPFLRKLAKRVGRPLLVSEVGYQSSLGSAIHPERAVGMIPDESLQADLYRAFLEVPVRDAVLDGVSFFRWSAFEAGPLNGGYSPKGKTAECILARAWAPAGISATSCATAGRVLG